MKIGINALYVVPGDVGGAEYYLVNLLNGLFTIDRKNEFILFVTPLNKDIYNPPSDNFRKVVIPFSNKKRTVRLLIEQTVLPYYAKKEKLDILHSPNNVAPLLKNTASVLTIQTLHNFLYQKDLPFFKTRYRQMHMKVSARRADHVITPSASTRADAIKILRLNPDRVTSILDYVSMPTLFPNGIHSDPGILIKYKIEKPYIFSPSSMYPYKNIAGMLKVLKILKEKFELPHRLVVAGRDDISYYPCVIKLARELGVIDSFQYIGNVLHEETPSLYRFADITFFPTYCETFGIPVLESMAIGTPVVCSNRSSLPEVAGDGAVQVDPDDVDGMSRSIHRLVRDQAQREKILKKGRERAQYFTCKNAARQTLKIYESVFAERNIIQ